MRTDGARASGHEILGTELAIDIDEGDVDIHLDLLAAAHAPPSRRTL